MNYKQVRTSMLLTQKEFAKQLGVSLGIVQRWEQGLNKPSLRYQRRINEFIEKNKKN